MSLLRQRHESFALTPVLFTVGLLADKGRGACGTTPKLVKKVLHGVPVWTDTYGPPEGPVAQP